MAGYMSACGLRKPCALSSRTRQTAVSEADQCSHRCSFGNRHLAGVCGYGSRLRVATNAAAVESTQGTTVSAKPCFEVLEAPQPGRMIKDYKAFVEDHRIRGYEVGPDQRTTIASIANLVQEVSSNHAVAMWGRSEQGFAADPALSDKGLIFVMTRLQLQVDEYPKWGDVVRVETWFMPSGKIGAQRDFLISCAKSGRVLGRGTSSWVMINLHTRRLCKLPDELKAKYMGFMDGNSRQAIPPQYTKAKIPEVTLPAEIQGPLQVARRSDIDMNGHVNNVTYLAWGLETVPQEVYAKCHLYQVEIDFKAECHCGDEVEGYAQRSAPPEALASNGAGPGSLSFTHTLRRCEGEACRELVRMRTVWRAGEAVGGPGAQALEAQGQKATTP